MKPLVWLAFLHIPSTPFCHDSFLFCNPSRYLLFRLYLVCDCVYNNLHLLVMRNTLHLSRWNSIDHSFSNLVWASRSFWSCMVSCGSRLSYKSMNHLQRVDYTRSGRLLMYIRNRRGPRYTRCYFFFC